MFVSNGSSGGVSVYSVTPGTGALSAVSGSPFPTPGTDPYAVTVDVTNQFLAVSDPGLNYVATYSIDLASGALSLRGIAPTGFTPFSVAMAGGATPVTYVPKFAYTVTRIERRAHRWVHHGCCNRRPGDHGGISVPRW